MRRWPNLNRVRFCKIVRRCQSFAGLTQRDLWLAPVAWMPAPMSVRAKESVATEKPVSRSVETPGRTNAYAESNSRTVYDRPWRWRRVVIPGCGGAGRLNHVCTGIRAQHRAKPECEHCHCHYHNFLSHECVPPVVWAIEPDDNCKVARKNGSSFLPTDQHGFTASVSEHTASDADTPTDTEFGLGNAGWRAYFLSKSET